MRTGKSGKVEDQGGEVNLEDTKFRSTRRTGMSELLGEQGGQVEQKRDHSD
jgi:hypothetical protein